MREAVVTVFVQDSADYKFHDRGAFYARCISRKQGP